MSLRESPISLLPQWTPISTGTVKPQEEASSSQRKSTTDSSFDIENSSQQTGDENGIFLTWTDLKVTVPDKKDSSRAILQGITGYVEPGKVLAVMGPSGCGKSTFLDTLAGRLNTNTSQSGEILINGSKQIAFGTSVYVCQEHALMTTLTVREAVYYAAQLQLPNSMTKAEKKQRAETTIKEMGLQDAMDTRIGGSWSTSSANGKLSSGQKRRVSICIEILTRPKLLFLDEPTTGLDSAASYFVMKRIVKLAREYRRTVIASIHQPSSEVFQLFHNLCLLSQGKTIYFGSIITANQFFASNGFPCPSMTNPCKHYMRIINKDFDDEIDQGVGRKINPEEVIDILLNSYESSEAHRHVQQRIYEICNQQNGRLSMEKKLGSFITQCVVLTGRSCVNMYRDIGYYWLRLAIFISLCLSIGTIFYNIGSSYASIQARASVLTFVAGLLSLMSIGGFPSFVEDMKIFTRERLNGHYGVCAFVVGNFLSSIPYLVVISIVSGGITYYMVGLHKDINHFIYFTLILLVCLMLVESVMMIVASIVPDFLMGIITACGIHGVMLLSAGFFRLPNDLPNLFWKYPIYYISYLKYAIQGLYKNEFQGLTFLDGGNFNINGDEILRNTLQVEMNYSKWVSFGILCGMIILYRLIFVGILKAIEKYKLMITNNIHGCC